ncbi:hypothetical protein [Flagellimonas meridianipacifica]|uniref:Outer membrane protein with beta-barrel domain n=1 Tax=Flagellimonas meridianipacifica TaxID=1080225 RepID=A0A2T0MK05_9FLAO|nr:hypothetical protein [Allomuricauda pacifica]PRX57928.1 hypothetical protein CLV81_1942 [Allomuricauda pacifica]
MKLKFAFLFSLFILSAISVSAQKTPANEGTYLGVSVQAYPAGIIPTVNLETYLNEKSSLLFRLGANFTDRQDFSDVNLTEEGEGFGGSIGFRKHFPLKTGKIVAGLITDLWSLEIDWTDVGPADNPISGTTDILVLQPYLEGGYFLPIKNSSSQIGLTLGFGREINIVTDGDEVAQDFIASIALQFMFGL